MRFFHKADNDLKEYLQTSCIHDGQFQQAIYNQITKEFSVHIENAIWNDSIDMVFAGVCEFSSVADYKWGDNETINAFVLITNAEPNAHKGKLNLAFEMFSGNQIRIVCSELRISSKTESL